MSVPCAAEGCVALATRGQFCTVHASMADGTLVPATPAKPRENTLEEAVDYVLSRFPRLSRFIMAVHPVRMKFPAVTQYSFHSPFATLLVSDMPGEQPYIGVVVHQLMHVAQQVRRFRRRSQVGLVQALNIGGSENRYVPWRDVDACRETEPPPITEQELALLHRQAGHCPRCGDEGPDLTWLYFRTPDRTWREMVGFAGWMAVCDTCREQVALFIDEQN
jgi:hypothetical protein